MIGHNIFSQSTLPLLQRITLSFALCLCLSLSLCLCRSVFCCCLLLCLSQCIGLSYCIYLLKITSWHTAALYNKLDCLWSLHLFRLCPSFSLFKRFVLCTSLSLLFLPLSLPPAVCLSIPFSPSHFSLSFSNFLFFHFFLALSLFPSLPSVLFLSPSASL